MFLIASGLCLAFLLPGCSSFLHNSPNDDPVCIGTVDSLNPYHPPAGYIVTLQGADTLTIKMFFTNYTETLLHYFTPVWRLWVSSTNGTELRYYEGYCNPSNDNTDKWYGSSGMTYKGDYATLNFIFDKLTCTETEGSCKLFPAATSDSLNYHFKGKKK
jgi:hypothetical protein